MQRVDLQVEPRAKTGKGAARSLRRAGRIPAVVYGGTEPPQPVVAETHRVREILHGAGGEHRLVNLRFSDGDDTETLTLLKEIQHDPVHGHVEHIDFLRVSPDRPIHTTVPIRIIGSSIGSKEGGVLEHLLREIDVECLPLEIPDEIEVEVTELKIGQSIHTSEVTVPERVRVLTNPETVVALVAAPTKAVVEAAPAEEAPAEEAAAAETVETAQEES